MSIEIVGIGTVAIPVRDQQRAVDFYCGTLGFEKRRDAEFGSGMRWIEVAPAGVSTTLAIPPAGPSATSGKDTGIRLTCEDAEKAHHELQTAGVDVDDEVMNWPGVPPMFSLRDPDNNTLYIVEQT
jgi:catechol 2,3-dioxygenase-like lactoylglutathione lyase family enzyme